MQNINSHLPSVNTADSPLELTHLAYDDITILVKWGSVMCCQGTTHLKAGVTAETRIALKPEGDESESTSTSFTAVRSAATNQNASVQTKQLAPS